MEIIIRKTKKILKTIGLIILVVICMLVGFHIWFINNSEKTIERLIAWRSNGKLRAKIKKLSIDYFNNSAEIKEMTIFNADTVSRGTSYRFTTQQLHFNIRSKWELIAHKKLLVDSLIFTSPDIVITRKAHTDSVFKKLPLAEELGNVYKAINNSLAVLNLERFEINEGKVIVRDAGLGGKTRFELDHIFLSIDHLKIDSAEKAKHTFAFSDRVVLRILKQTIKLPDNKSSISFNQLLIDSKLEIIEFANPAIKIYPANGFKNSFIASAAQLNITGLDFNTLYSQPLIKIDSVFMQNPKGDLQLFSKNKNTSGKKQMPLDDALRNLPVAININHVVVQNGTVAVSLHQNKKITIFDTNNDNLSMVGVSLNDTSSKVLNIQGFNYIVRNYIGYTPDSIYRYRFDSLQFIDNRIILYNFNITTIKKVQSILIRNYTVPQFEITDMDWPSFIFNNHFKASKAILFNAKFNIEKNNEFNTKNTAQNSGKKSIYQTLSVMDNLLDLDELKVVNGEFNAKQGEDLSLHITHLNFDVNANELTEAKTFKELVKSVKELSFDSAMANNAALSLNISTCRFNNRDKSLLFEHVLLNANNQSLKATLNNVAVSDFSFDNKELDVNEIQWSDGNINVDGRNMTGNKLKPINKKNYIFSLNNIVGNNSKLYVENDNLKAQVYIKRLTAINLSKSINNPFQLNKLFVDGENAIVDLPNAQLKCENLLIKDEDKSIFKNISYVSRTGTDTVNCQIPFISFIPFINKTISTNTVVMDSVFFKQPRLYSTTKIHESKNIMLVKAMEIPAVNINGLRIDDASARLFFINGDNNIAIDNKKVFIKINNIVTQNNQSLLLNNINFLSDGISINKNDNLICTSNGNIKAAVSDFVFNPSTQNWQIKMDRFSADNFDYLNKIKEDNINKLFINNINLQHIIANNENIDEGLPWLINTSNAFISFGSINWQTPASNFLFHHFIFDATQKQVVIDSISFAPAQTQQDFVDKLIYRKAFITAKSGRIKIEGLSYLDSLIYMQHISGTNAFLDIYSDNLKKAKAQSIKPLPVEALKAITIPLQIDTLQLNNMVLKYTEVNALTKRIGTLSFNSLNGNVLNIKTRPQLNADSLRTNFAANFMEQLPLYFKMQSAYNDSLNGFAVQVNVGRGEAQILNPILEPFVLLRAKSGFIDTMHMTANANDYTAHGNMRLYYHGLNAALLDSSAMVHPRFKIRLLSFLANSFAIRNNNSKRITNFDFVRTRTKSAANYLLKMIVEGAAGNVMPQASKILIKKQLKKEARRQEILDQENDLQNKK